MIGLENDPDVVHIGREREIQALISFGIVVPGEPYRPVWRTLPSAYPATGLLTYQRSVTDLRCHEELSPDRPPLNFMVSSAAPVNQIILPGMHRFGQ